MIPRYTTDQRFSPHDSNDPTVIFYGRYLYCSWSIPRLCIYIMLFISIVVFVYSVCFERFTEFVKPYHCSDPRCSLTKCPLCLKPITPSVVVCVNAILIVIDGTVGVCLYIFIFLYIYIYIYILKKNSKPRESGVHRAKC